jgi:hypothetical protein
LVVGCDLLVGCEAFAGWLPFPEAADACSACEALDFFPVESIAATVK